MELKDAESCIEIMTGAVVPMGADTVIMYEHLEMVDGHAVVNKPFVKGQNVHSMGSDVLQGDLVLPKGTIVTSAEIGVLATVGKTNVLVEQLPRVAIFSTGDELVGIDEIPKPHQIRRSNTHTIGARLFELGISATRIHVSDDKLAIKTALQRAIGSHDALVLSGGVSKGKYDYLPEVFEELKVKKLFHRVAQRPGKPFWFGSAGENGTLVFGFPGNPTSTFVNFHLYFLPWLYSSVKRPSKKIAVFLNEPISNDLPLTRFFTVKAEVEQGRLVVRKVKDNGSGDLASLTRGNGIIALAPGQKYETGDCLQFFPTRSII